MTRISQPITPEPEIDDEAAITRGTRKGLGWQSVLLWFLRISAVLCMVRGLTYWSELLGLFEIDFTDRPLLQQGAIVFFSAIYCFAAVGLWLAAAWGAAVWILALIGESLFVVLEPGMKFIPAEIALGLDRLRSPGHLLLGVAMVVIYLLLAWLAAREQK